MVRWTVSRQIDGIPVPWRKIPHLTILYQFSFTGREPIKLLELTLKGNWYLCILVIVPLVTLSSYMNSFCSCCFFSLDIDRAFCLFLYRWLFTTYIVGASVSSSMCLLHEVFYTYGKRITHDTINTWEAERSGYSNNDLITSTLILPNASIEDCIQTRGNIITLQALMQISYPCLVEQSCLENHNDYTK